MISWPTQRMRRDWCRDRNIPRLLVVEPGQAPPLVIDTLEDWVRAPQPKADLDVRMTTLTRRHRRYLLPYLEDDTLVYQGRRVRPSPSQLALLRQFVDAFEEPVARADLLASLGLDPQADEERRNLLDLHVGRLRRRLAPAGLTLRTVWGSGYVLEPAGHGVEEPWLREVATG